LGKSTLVYLSFVGTVELKPDANFKRINPNKAGQETAITQGQTAQIKLKYPLSHAVY
jgi:hypothetical protein